MERWLGKYSEVLYARMRVVVGLLFACHGAQKLFGVIGGEVQLSSWSQLPSSSSSGVGSWPSDCGPAMPHSSQASRWP